MGKGRQRGATYCNEAVIELSDILRLKRKSVTQVAACLERKESSHLQVENLNYMNSVVPVVHLAPSREEDRAQKIGRSKKRKLSASRDHPLPLLHFSPISHSVSDDDNPTDGAAVVSVDLTSQTSFGSMSNSLSSLTTVQSLEHSGSVMCGDEDILAGCSVLLSFCNAKIASA